jgi:hypothetical protein
MIVLGHNINLDVTLLWNWLPLAAERNRIPEQDSATKRGITEALKTEEN